MKQYELTKKDKKEMRELFNTINLLLSKTPIIHLAYNRNKKGFATVSLMREEMDFKMIKKTYKK